MTRFGPLFRDDGVLFRLWAPDVPAVSLVRPGEVPLPLQPAADGFFERFVAGAGAGTRYRFRIGDIDVPDPASRAQDADVFGWSVVVAPGAPRAPFRPRPWHEAVIVEVHVGAASAEGTFRGLIPKLDHFRDAGFNTIEIMPIADFVGARNWGYDGVLPFAPDAGYGTPDDLRALVEAAHDRGLAIMLDVVYNHFGPSGNYLHHYAERFFSKETETLWGAAIALDQPPVRAFFTENVRYWLGEVGFDGLRFDAVHAFATAGVDAFMAELAEAGRAAKPEAYLVLENDRNEARWLERDEHGRPRRFDAQWNDDFHHAFHVLTTGETAGYLGDFGEDPVAAAGRSLAEGFIFQGQPSPHRAGQRRGEPSAHLPPEAFVAFVQNHDHIGNRPFGERLASLVGPERLALLRFVLMLSPQVPMFFMGEEAWLDTPFPFFCDFDDELGEAIRQGRQREFAAFFREHAGEAGVRPAAGPPDPLAAATLEMARLPWERLATAPARDRIAETRALAQARRRLVWPLTGTRYLGAKTERAGDALALRWRFAGGELAMALAVSDAGGAVPAPDGAPDGTVGEVARDGGTVRLGPWAGAVWSRRA